MTTSYLTTYPTSTADPTLMAPLAYTATEKLLYDYSATEDFYVLVSKALYRVGIEYALKWFGLNTGNTLTIIRFPFNLNYANQALIQAPPRIFSTSASSGKKGDSILINGSGFASASSVRFNGISATFVVVTDAKIITTVP
jgi:hypothetical protein